MLKISANFSNQYVESLKITFKEQKKTWEYFCQNVPIFKEITCEKDIDRIARQTHKKYENTINDSIADYKSWWNEEKYGVEKKLEKLFEVKISKTIYANVCITPLFTRNIDKLSFLLPTNASKLRFYNITTHELIHFYYYYALQQSNNYYDDMSIWRISELIVSPIIKYLFPDYIYLHNTYHFNSEEIKKAEKLVKLYIDKKISLDEMIRRMIMETKKKNNYKLSKFAHFYYKGNDICAYNALTMDTVYFEKNFESKIKEIIAKPDGYNEAENKVKTIFDALKQAEIVVDKNYDEKEIIDSIKPAIFQGVDIRVMVLHLTDFCNLKCKYCFIEGGMCQDYKRQNMTKEVMKAAIDKYIQILKRSKLKANPSIVFYGGEPLANWEIIEYGLKYLEECKQNGLINHDIDKVIITNGTLITDEIAAMLKKYDVLVSLSLDGIKEVHDYNRIDYDNKGSFDRTIRGLNLLRKHGVEPSISCVMSPFAIKHVDETIDFLLKDLKIKGLGFNHVSIIPKLNYYDPKYEEEFADSILHVQDIIQEKYDDVYERRMGHKINCFVDKLLLRADCTGCGEQISVSPDGEIGICQGYMGTRKTFNNSVFDKDYFPDQDPTFIEWSKRSPLNMDKCLNCPALATCGGGCPRNADMINGSIWDVDSAFCHFALKANEWLVWKNFEDQGYCYEK